MDPYPDWPNLAAMMFARATDWPEQILFRFFRNGAWRDMRWAEYARLGAAAARGLRAAGIAAGDRVLIISENRPEISIAELGLMAIGAVPVPAYTTNTASDHAHLLRDCAPMLALVSSPSLAATLQHGARIAGCDVPLRLLDPGPDDRPFNTFLKTADQPPDDIVAMAAAIPPDRLACLIYTSGTSGMPRGVMLSHRAILANCRGADERLASLGFNRDVYLSFLPNSHAFEHTVGQFYLPSVGTTIAYARGLEHLAADLLDARPTILVVVPRLLATLRGRIQAAMARQPAWRQRLFALALRDGVAWAEAPCHRHLAAWLRHRFYDLAVRRRVRARFGGRLRALVSGSAPLDADLERFFRGLGLIVLQGYGQTEAGPVISVTAPDQPRPDTVGPPLPNVAVRIADDGEILVSGDGVMDGYWRQPDETAAALREGWLHTGDVGALDKQGCLRITDRKKDFIVLSGGEKVAPARIESLLMQQPGVSQAVLAGDGLRGPIALIVPDPDASGPGEIEAAIATVNAGLPRPERVRTHIVVPPFTLENGLLTPTHKIRRRLVIARYHERIM